MVSPLFYTKENKKLKDCWISKADIWRGAFKKSLIFKKLIFAVCYAFLSGIPNLLNVIELKHVHLHICICLNMP